MSSAQSFSPCRSKAFSPWPSLPRSGGAFLVSRPAAADRCHKTVAQVCTYSISLAPYLALLVNLAPPPRGFLFPAARAFRLPELSEPQPRTRSRGASRWLVDRRRLVRRWRGRFLRGRKGRNAGNWFRRRFRRRLGYLGPEHNAPLIARKRPKDGGEFHQCRGLTLRWLQAQSVAGLAMTFPNRHRHPLPRASGASPSRNNGPGKLACRLKIGRERSFERCVPRRTWLQSYCHGRWNTVRLGSART